MFGWEFYRDTLFSTPAETHAFLLGFCSGVVLVTLLYRGYPRASLALLVGFVVFAWGFPNVVDVPLPGGQWEHYGTRDVQRKPWYYFASLLPTLFLTPVAIRTVVGPEHAEVVNPFHSELEAVADDIGGDATVEDAIRYLIDSYRPASVGAIPGDADRPRPSSRTDAGSAPDDVRDGSDRSGGQGPETGHSPASTESRSDERS